MVWDFHSRACLLPAEAPRGDPSLARPIHCVALDRPNRGPEEFIAFMYSLAIRIRG